MKLIVVFFVMCSEEGERVGVTGEPSNLQKNNQSCKSPAGGQGPSRTPEDGWQRFQNLLGTLHLKGVHIAPTMVVWSNFLPAGGELSYGSTTRRLPGVMSERPVLLKSTSSDRIVCFRCSKAATPNSQLHHDD